MKTLLDFFEESGKEIFEITQKEWVNISLDNIKYCDSLLGINTDEVTLEIKTGEAEDYHKNIVLEALRNNIIVSNEVMKDYPNLIEVVNNERKEEQQKIELINYLPELKEGVKITVDGSKLTIVNKDKDSILCRLYRSRKKGIRINLTDKLNSFSIGWC